jgi:hypothetical protein
MDSSCGSATPATATSGFVVFVKRPVMNTMNMLGKSSGLLEKITVNVVNRKMESASL